MDMRKWATFSFTKQFYSAKISKTCKMNVKLKLIMFLTKPFKKRATEKYIV